MALTIAQEYTYFEQGLGATTVRFVVSNDYESLFNQTTDWTTGIISLEDCSEDLNINDGAFAVNQLTFKINALTCVTEHDTNTLYFLLGATDRTKYRFCALFFNPAYTAGKCNINTLKFIGRIEDKISADDIAWFNAAQYSADIQAVRDWKFSAQSFDVSILDSVSIKSLYEGYFAPGNITETPDIAGITDAEINALFEHKPNYLDKDDYHLGGGFYTGERFQTYTMNLGLLYSALELLINKAELIIADIINVPTFTIELVPTALGYEACPVWYYAPKSPVPDGTPADSFRVTKVESVPAVRIPLELSNSAVNGIYIHKKMVKSSSVSEQGMNFQRFDNLSDLLFSIARNFGLYLMFEYVTGTHIRISLTSRTNIIESDFTYIINASTGKLDISSDAKSGSEKNYTGQANNYCGDGFDKFVVDRSRTPQLSPRIGKTADGQTKSGERLLLSSSPTLQEIESQKRNPNGQYPPNFDIPQNTIFKIEGVYKTDLSGTAYPESQDLQELLHTAIYVRTTPSVYDDLLQVETEPFVWRPIAHIFVSRGDKDISYNTLADFITDIDNYDREFYKFEREYTIPYWSGFSKFTTGASPSVHNIKLGAKIKFEETLRVLNETTNVFADETVEEIYVVVGIKRKLGSPETTIKLHRTSRYAYSSFAGDDPEPAGLLITPSIAAALPTVRCVYTTQVSLSGITATDGITPVSGESVLVSNNTDPKENGPYIVQSGAWERTDLVLGAGVIINVREGTVNAGSNWMVTTPKEIIIIGTDNISFKRTDASSIVDGSGIVPISKGGTGAATASAARTNLGIIDDVILFDTVSLENITLSGLQTINDVTGASGVRVLVNGQSDQSQNGGYFMRSGAWERIADDMHKGVFCVIREGTAATKDTIYLQSRPNNAPDGSSSAWFRRVDSRYVHVSSIDGSFFVETFLGVLDASGGRSALELGDMAVKDTVEITDLEVSDAVASLLDDLSIASMRNTLGLTGAITLLQPKRALTGLKSSRAYSETNDYVGYLGTDNNWYRIDPNGTLLSGVYVGVTTCNVPIASYGDRVILFSEPSTSTRRYSTDGGATWNAATNSTSGNSLAADINRTTGVVCATYSGSSSNIARSTDWGATWADVGLGAAASYSSLVTDNVATWLVATVSTMRRSTDDGATWTSVTLPGSGFINRLSYANGRFLIYDSSAAKIHHSATGATGSWTSFDAPSGVSAQNIYYRDSRYFLDFGWSFLLDDPTSWTIESTGQQLAANKICFLSGNMYTIVNNLLYVIS